MFGDRSYRPLQLRNIVKTVARAVQPLELALDGHRSFASNHVAAAKRPAFLAIMSVLLRWPDLTQAQDLVHGYRIVVKSRSALFTVQA